MIRIIILILLISSCNLPNSNQVKNNMGSSRSIQESKEIGVFAKYLKLITLDDCKTNYSTKLNSWFEQAWKPSKILGKNSITRLKYNNFFFELTDKEEIGDVFLVNKKNEKRKNAIYSIEPILGYVFILRLDENIEDYMLEIIHSGNKCQYNIIIEEESSFYPQQ